MLLPPLCLERRCSHDDPGCNGPHMNTLFVEYGELNEIRLIVGKGGSIMKKNAILTAFLALVLTFSLAACGAKDDGKTEATTQTLTGDVITVSIPSGWSLVSGTDMNGANSSDYICHAEKFEIGDPYLQVAKDDRDIAAIQNVLQSEETFGEYIGEVESNGTTWYVAENAAAAMVSEKACLVRGYECDFSSTEVQGILSSIQWAE